MTLLLYAVTAAAMLWLGHRFVRSLTPLAALLVALLPLCFTAPALLTGRVYAPVDLVYREPPLEGLREQYGIGSPRNPLATDLVLQMIPWRKSVQWSYARGEWPLWNPFILSGDILGAAAQPAVYSPFTLLAILLPVAQSFTFTASITFFLAAFAAFFLLRDLGAREWTALLGAAGWAFCTGISFFVLWPIGMAWALLPLVMAAARRIVLEPTLRHAALLTVAFVLLILAGHPESILHVTAIGGVYALYHLLRARRTAGRAIALGIGAGVVSLMLTAIYLLPLFEAVGQSEEHASRAAIWAKLPRGIPVAASLARLATDALPFLHLRAWSVGHNVPVDSAAVGSIILALAVFGLWRAAAAERWFFAGLLFFSLAARSETPLLERVLQKLPGFDVALNSRFSFAAAFAAVVLSVFALEWILGHGDFRAAALTAGCVLIVLAAGSWWARGQVIGSPYPWAHWKIAAELGGLAALTALLAVRPPLRFLAPALLALLLLQRAAEEGTAYPSIPAGAAYPQIPLLTSIDRSGGPLRIVATGDGLMPGTSAMYGLEDVRGYEALTLLRYHETYPLWCEFRPVWFNRVDDLSRPFLSFLNVRYAITADDERVPAGWTEVANRDGARLLLNDRPIPRAFVPRHVRFGTVSKLELVEMGEERDFLDRAWVRTSLPPHERANGPGTVEIRREGSEYTLGVDMASGGWVVISESAWKGWRAYLDGRRVRIQLANHAFLSVFVPPGRHQLRLVYLPQSFVIGRWISFVTLLGIGVGWAVGVWRRKRSLGRAPS